MPEYEPRPLAATRVVVVIEAKDAATSSIIFLAVPALDRGYSEGIGAMSDESRWFEGGQSLSKAEAAGTSYA